MSLPPGRGRPGAGAGLGRAQLLGGAGSPVDPRAGGVRGGRRRGRRRARLDGQALGRGRIYAGSRSNWAARPGWVRSPSTSRSSTSTSTGSAFTRPTWSLSSPAEYRFRYTHPSRSQRHVFDVPYLIQPSDRRPPAGAELVAERGRHSLWEMPVHGAIEVCHTAPIEADRTKLGVQIAPGRASPSPARTSTRGGVRRRPRGPGDPRPGRAAGRAPGPRGDLLRRSRRGRASATVETTRTAAVILKASFDNRWCVTVDGAVVEAQMFAPSLVGRLVPPAGTRSPSSTPRSPGTTCCSCSARPRSQRCSSVSPAAATAVTSAAASLESGPALHGGRM